MFNSLVETIDLDHGVSIAIHRDEDAPNPRIENTNLGVMACWHRRRSLGDNSNGGSNRWAPAHGDVGEMWQSILSEIDLTPYALRSIIAFIKQHHLHLWSDWVDGFAIRPNARQQRGHWKSFLIDLVATGAIPQEAMTSLVSLLETKGLVILPIWGYEHGGITLKAGHRTGQFADRFDSGLVGYIYALPKAIFANWNATRPADKVFCAHDMTTKSARGRAIDSLLAEIDEYNQFLAGDVFGFVVHTPDGDGESCWGIYGRESAVEQAMEDARNAVEAYGDETRMAGAGI